MTLLQANPVEPFRGTVSGNAFELQCVISYRNSMLPRIRGKVAVGPGGGSVVQLQHRLHPFVQVFAGVWLGIVSLVVLSFGVLRASGKSTMGGFALMPVGMLLFEVALFVLPFWYEVRKSRPWLLGLLLQAPAGA